MPERRRMPAERESITHRFEIRGEEKCKGYLTVGLYEDGTVGEIFVKMDRQGSATSGFIDAWAIAFSMLLQKGDSLDELCDKFMNTSFPPCGITDNEHVRIAKSPIDYIARYLKAKFGAKAEAAAA